MRYPILTAALLLASVSYSYADNVTKMDDSEKTPELFSFDNLSGNITALSNYIWRGVSQTNDYPAGQGELTYEYRGFYVGTWASNVEFDGVTGHLEVDANVGYGGTFKNDWSYDVGLTRYGYINSDPDLDYSEAHATLSYKILQIGMAYTNNEFNTGTDGYYYSVGVNYDIPAKYVFNKEGFSIGATLGRSVLKPEAGESYYDYGATLSKKLTEIFTIALGVTNTSGGGLQIDQAGDQLNGFHVFTSLVASF